LLRRFLFAAWLGAMPVLCSSAAAADELRASERAFLDKAAEVTRQEMRLAEVGVSQAGSSDVRSHATQLAGDSRRLSDALEDMMRRKGTMAGAPVGGTSESYRRLLEKTGRDFDREFVRTATDLAGNVLTLFEQAAANAKDEDVRSFASAQLPLLRDLRNRAVALKQAVE
jgi:putative membrane protein